MNVLTWPPGDGEMAQSIREFDWSPTPLGPISHWPQSLKTIVDLMLDARSMMSLVWGPKAIHLYNDSFTELLREHCALTLGRSAYETFARSRGVFEADIAAGMAGKSARLVAQRHPVLRQGRLEDAWFDVDYTPIRDETGAVAGVLWIMKETTAQHLAEEVLRASEVRHRLLIESWTQAVWETNAVGNVVTDSPSWRAYTGQTLEEWLGYGWLDAIHPDDRPYAERQWRDASTAHTVVDAEFRLRAPHGGWRWTNVRAAPLLDAEGQIEKWIGTNIDIDARMRAENALRESEEHYRKLFEAMDEAFAVVEVLRDDTGEWCDFRFLEVNPAFMAHTSMPYPVGQTATELLGTPNPRWTQMYGRALDTGEKLRVQEVEPTLGRVFDLNIFSLNRAQSRVAVLFTDITAQVRADAALRETEARFRILADTAPALIWQNDAEGGNIFINQRFLDFTGMSVEAIRGVGWHAFIHPDEAETYVTDYLAAVRDRGDWYNRNRLRRHDGAWRWFENYARPIFAEDGRYLGHVGVSTDVTESVEAVEVLREAEGRQAFLLDFSDTLRPLSDPASIRAAATRILGERLHANRALYAEVERDTWVVKEAYEQGVNPRAVGRHPMAAFGPWIIDDFQAGRLLIIRDLTIDGRFDVTQRASHEAYEILGAVAVPLVKKQKLVAILVVHSATPRDWSEMEIALVKEAAERTWAAVERARAEAALRESEQRFRGFAENSADVLWIASSDGRRLEYLSPAFERVFGEDRERIMADLGRWAELIHPDDREAALTYMPRAIAGEVAIAHYRVVRPKDGRIVHFRDTGFPIRDVEGAITRVAGIVQDVTDMIRTGEALEAEKERFRTLDEGIPQLVWRSSDEGLWTWSSPQWQAYTGQSQAQSHGRGWLEPMHPDDLEVLMQAWHEARSNGRLDVEHRVRRAADGTWRWHQTRSVPVRNGPTPAQPKGCILEWLGTTTDIEDLKRLQGEQQVLVAELQHRTRNLLGVVRNVARRSIPPSPGRDQYDARLSALGRVQSFLSRSTAYAVKLADVVHAELEAAGTSDRITVDGPDIELPGESVQAVALAVHELATNAVKYGAIAQPSGRLSVTWRVKDIGDQDGQCLIIDWRESGVAMPAEPPARQGYGTELITRALPYQLRAETALEFTPDGVQCRIVLPAKSFNALDNEVFP